MVSMWDVVALLLLLPAIVCTTSTFRTAVSHGRRQMADHVRAVRGTPSPCGLPLCGRSAAFYTESGSRCSLHVGEHRSHPGYAERIQVVVRHG